MKYLILIMTLSFSICAEDIRIVSTSPSICYTLIDLGLGSQIVGSSNYCEHKSTKIGSLITPNLEEIVKLRPSLVLSQKIKNDLLSLKLAKLNINTETYEFNSYNDVKSSIKAIGKKLNKKSKASAIIKKFRALEKKLDSKGFNGEFIFAISVKERASKVVGFTIAGINTYFSDVVSVTGLENVVKKSSGYLEWDIEKLIKSNAKYFFLLTREGEEIDSEIKRQLKKYKDVKLIEIKSLGAHVPSTRTIIFLEELLKGLHDKS